MARTGGPALLARPRTIAASAVLLGAVAFAACTSDAAKEAAIAELAVGTWRCEPAADGASEDPFELTIEDGTFSAQLSGGPATGATGTWAVEDGDLTIELDGQSSDLTQMAVDRFDDLTTSSTEFTLSKPGLFAPDLIEEDMSVEEMSELAQNPPPLDVDVTIRGTRAVTFDTADGDPWTCERQ